MRRKGYSQSVGQLRFDPSQFNLRLILAFPHSKRLQSQTKRLCSLYLAAEQRIESPLLFSFDCACLFFLCRRWPGQRDAGGAGSLSKSIKYEPTRVGKKIFKKKIGRAVEFRGCQTTKGTGQIKPKEKYHAIHVADDPRRLSRR